MGDNTEWFLLRCYFPGFYDYYLVFNSDGRMKGALKKQAVKNFLQDFDGTIIDPADPKTLEDASKVNRFNRSLFLYFSKVFGKGSPITDSFHDFNKIILNHLPTERKIDILDLGCGNGFYSSSLLGKGNRIVALDLLERKSLKEVNGLEFVQGEAEKLPFDKESFDLVLVLFLLEHVANVEQTIAQIIRVTKPSGKAIIAIPLLSKEEVEEIKNLGKPAINFEHLRSFADVEIGSWCLSVSKLVKQIKERGAIIEKIQELDCSGKSKQLLLTIRKCVNETGKDVS